MQLVALVKDLDHVCCRYRLEAFRPHLERAGYTLAYQILPRSWWRRLRLFVRLRDANVILQRFLLPEWEIALLRRQARRLIYDFDDAVFLRDSYSGCDQHHPRRLRRFAATVRRCDAIVAGNHFLAEQAGRWTGVERIHVIPTCVDPSRYLGASSVQASDGKELVWIGSSSTLQGLEQVAPMLEALGREVPGLRLRVICDRFPRFAHLQVIRCPWNASREADDLTRGDIGISWIPDDLWSRGKCGLKVLQYMAAGLPVVANPVGVHPQIIRHGETGYLASTFEEWRAAIVRLTQDPVLRRGMGEAGRRQPAEAYYVPRGVRAWLDLLASLV